MTSEEITVAVFDALTAMQIPFMVSGSLASNFYALPRLTQDADLVLDFNRLQIDALAARLGDRFEIDRQVSFELVTASPRLVLRVLDEPFEVELFGLTDDPHDQERFARRQRVEVLGRMVDLPTPEDVIISKCRWFKIAHRRKDIEDARNVIAVQASALDWPYLRRWCTDLDLLRELKQAEQA